MSETDVQKVIDDTKATLASLEAQGESKVKSIWGHYEIYFVGFVALVVGLVVGHLVK